VILWRSEPMVACSTPTLEPFLFLITTERKANCTRLWSTVAFTPIGDILTSVQLKEWVQDNILAFLIGYTLATGELHLIIADVMGLA